MKNERPAPDPSFFPKEKDIPVLEVINPKTQVETSVSDDSPDVTPDPVIGQSAPGPHDPLLACLEVLGKIHGLRISKDGAIAGLPLANGRLTPSLFIKAAERSGFTARISKRKLSQLPDVLMPVVAIMEDNSASIIVGRRGKKKFEIIPGDLSDSSIEVTTKDLESDYGGYVILVKPKFDPKRESEEVSEDNRKGKGWFWGTLWKFRGYYWKVAIASLLINVFGLASPLFIMNVYDRVVPYNAIETLWVFVIGAVIVFGFEFILRLLRAYFVDLAGKRADLIIASKLYEQVMSISLRAKPASSGAFAQQIRGYEFIREFFTSATMVSIVDLPFVIFFIGIVYLLGGAIAIVPATAALFIIVVGLCLQIPLARSSRSSHKKSLDRNALLVESLMGLEAIKGASAESTFQRRMERAVQESGEVEIKTRWLAGLGQHLMVLTHHLVSIGVVVVGVYQIQKGAMTVGALIACVILGGKGLAPLGIIVGLISRLQQSMTSYKALKGVMKLEREHDLVGGTVSPENFVPRIEFKEVNFKYPGKDTPVLKDLSFKVEPGERIAILGKIGSGKSTMIRLLLGLYRPDEGSILLDGRDIAQLHTSELRRNVGYVGQDNWLFSGTVRDNIAIGRPWASDASIERASNLAGLDSFIGASAMGYDMPVGERGDRLSGGQRQAVVLARAFVSEPMMLALDEPTSSMDLVSEKQFINRLGEYLLTHPERTLIVSTHKPALLALVNRIIVVDQGKVVADGPREDVMKRLKGLQGLS